MFLSALVARLLPLVRGGGLTSYGSYDDAVYFAAAEGLVHGQLPYRDFLILHPPGIAVLLAPFAALSSVMTDSAAMSVARVTWMIMGSTTAAAITILVWRLAPVGGIVAGLAYAFLWPAAFVERSTYLEAPQNLLLVIALILLAPFAQARTHRIGGTATVVAGLLIGVTLSIKIWAIVPAVIIALWVWRRYGRRFGGFLLGVAASAIVIDLPFFLAAPRRMWSMVINDQVSRTYNGFFVTRLANTIGMTPYVHGRQISFGLVVACVAVVIMVVLALRRPAARMIVLLYAAAIAVLLAAPPTFVHYGAFPAVPAAICAGVAVAELLTLARRIDHPIRRLSSVGAVFAISAGAIAVLAIPDTTARAGTRLPPTSMIKIARSTSGCVTFDDPSTAIMLDVLSRDLNRGCPLVVDLGGESHLFPVDAPRVRNSGWQHFALDYLRSGYLVIVHRVEKSHAFLNAHSRHIVHSWAVVAHHGSLWIRRGPGHQQDPRIALPSMTTR